MICWSFDLLLIGIRKTAARMSGSFYACDVLLRGIKIPGFDQEAG